MSILWTHSFSVTDSALWAEKFTIYRITSVVFPADQPAALSCVTVWKRFSDVKELYQKLNKQTRKERLPVTLPALKRTQTRYFTRFEPHVIEGRRQWILELLECISNHPSLYSCDAFTKFLQSGYTPPLSDSPTPLKVVGIPPLETTNGSDKWSDSSDPSSSSICEDQQSIVTTSFLPTSTRTSAEESTTIEVFANPPFSNNYIIEASERFNEALLLEVNDRPSEALATYKDGIEVLLGGIRVDPDSDRRRLAKEKVEKYLSRSENLYELFIKPRTHIEDGLISGVDMASGLGNAKKELPATQLAKYKVLRVLDNNTMSVQELTTRRFFIIKSIDRTEDWQRGDGDYHYMVHLVNYFVTECVVFLLLQPASGGRLVDYMNSYATRALTETGEEAIETGETEDAQPSEPSSTDTGEVDIEKLLRSSHKLLSSVQETLDGKCSPREEEEAVEAQLKGSLQLGHQISGNQRIPEECLRQWAKELIVAVDTLHLNHVLLGHLDMTNILLGKSGQLLLTYYNYKELSSKANNLPEESVCSAFRTLDRSSDWMMVGAVLYELLTGHRYVDVHPNWWCFFEVQFPEDVHLSSSAMTLLQGLLANSSSRMGFKEICAHPFFSEIPFTQGY